MANLYILCGIPGSGKSTFVKNHFSTSARIISRDEIRFSLLGAEDDYFSQEEKVKKIFYQKINKSLEDGMDTFVDQTSLTKKARAFLLSQVTAAYDKVIVIWVKTSLKVALARNEERDGRAYVPRGVIRRMYQQFEEPTYNEGFDQIFVYEDGKLSLEVQ